MATDVSEEARLGGIFDESDSTPPTQQAKRWSHSTVDSHASNSMDTHIHAQLPLERVGLPWTGAVERAGMNLAKALDADLGTWVADDANRFDTMFRSKCPSRTSQDPNTITLAHLEMQLLDLINRFDKQFAPNCRCPAGLIHSNLAHISF